MGRRALRSPDQDRNLSQHLYLPEQLPEPWNTNGLFGRAAPLVIEVGSGKGMFMVASCQKHPEWNLLGIEIAPKYARYTADRLCRRGAEHAKMVSGDAEPIFASRLPAECVHQVHVYFPDPWWKRRHRRRRVMNDVFVRNVERVLEPGGSLHFWTDVQEYFDVTVDLLHEVTQLVGPEPVSERTPESDLDFQTNFERRMRMKDLPIYRSRFDKPSSPAGSVPEQP